MKIALYVLIAIIGTMAVVDIVYMFTVILGEIRDSYQRRLYEKYRKKEGR